MTGFSDWITRAGERMLVDLDEMTNDELTEWATEKANDGRLPTYRGWTFAAALASWIRDNVHPLVERKQNPRARISGPEGVVPGSREC